MNRRTTRRTISYHRSVLSEDTTVDPERFFSGESSAREVLEFEMLVTETFDAPVPKPQGFVSNTHLPRIIR